MAHEVRIDPWGASSILEDSRIPSNNLTFRVIISPTTVILLGFLTNEICRPSLTPTLKFY